MAAPTVEEQWWVDFYDVIVNKVMTISTVNNVKTIHSVQVNNVKTIHSVQVNNVKTIHSVQVNNVKTIHSVQVNNVKNYPQCTGEQC